MWIFTTFTAVAEHDEDVAALHKEIAEANTKIAETNDELTTRMSYGQYYDRLDDFDEAQDEENDELAKEYARQMERLKAAICEHDPKWERCDVE